MAKRHHMHVAPHSIHREETNVGNDPARLAALCEKHKIGVSLDSHHVRWEWEEADPSEEILPPPDAFWKKAVPFAPVHVHLSGPDRGLPSAKDPFLTGLVKRLKALEYKGRVSADCMIADWSREPGLALAELKTLFRT